LIRTEVSAPYRYPWVGLLVVIPLLAAAWMVDLPAKWGGFIGDSAVYYAMADSLAQDGDLLYTREDLVRITKEWSDGPQGILLSASETDPAVIHYAKPMLYPLLAAPLVRLLNTNGLLVFNALCFLVIISIGFYSFPRAESRTFDTVLWTLIFWGLSSVTPYVFTLTPDLFNSAIVMTGLLPWLVWQRRQDRDHAVYLLLVSGIVLGLSAAARPPNALFIVIPAWSYARKHFDDFRNLNWKRLLCRVAILIAIGTCFAAGAYLFFWASRELTGHAIAHGGFRKRIVGHFPFEAPGITFLNTGNEISTRSTQFVFHWSTLWLNIRYFFFGRFTGMVLYFLPAAAACLLALPWISKDPETGKSNGRFSAAAVCFGLVLFHLIYIPSNYHGGSCAVGNRYLISYLPAFFFLLRNPPGRKTILVIAGVTAIMSGALALNPIDTMTHYRDASKRDVYNRFLPEITLLNSWPVDDLNHVRVPFEGYFAYFADDNHWGKELDGIWVKGDAQTAFVLRCWKPEDVIRVKLTNGGVHNRIQIRIGSARYNIKADPGERFSFEIDPGNPKLFYNLGFTDRPSRPSFCYPVTVSTTDGFIPKFTEPGNDDSRFLGCFIQIMIPS
jgi:hypothetical protein